MGKMSRRKGWKGENEVVHTLRDAGIPANRIAPLEAGGEFNGDVRAQINGAWHIVSVKYSQGYPKYNYDAIEHAEFLFGRRNGKQWLVTMEFETFDKLLKGTL